VSDHNGREVLLGTTDEIGPPGRDSAENLLRAYFRERREQLVSRTGETLVAAQARITKLAQSALSDTGAVWWSGYEVEKGR
jgi:hypothetical protein